MKAASRYVVPVMGRPPYQSPPPTPPQSPEAPVFANYLPDELLLEVLDYVPREPESQSALARLCLVSRQWYDVAVSRLYEEPHLVGKAYELFVRTICPSVLTHIKPSELAGLVKVLNLSYIVHQSTKATTARLLNRTKPSLQHFVAPQASFAINCWASLSKCSKLRVLDLSLISESISYQSLNQTVRQLPELAELYLPRCGSRNEDNGMGHGMQVQWPPRLQHLSLSGSVHGRFMWDMLNSPENFPHTLSSLAISHTPAMSHQPIKELLKNLAGQLTCVDLRSLPAVKQGRLNSMLDWLPNLRELTIATDYIDVNFGHMPPSFNPTWWMQARPLETLNIVSSGNRDVDPSRAFTPVDLFTLIDERFLGRLRFLSIAKSTGWASKDEGSEVEALELALCELDKENWENRRWHYQAWSGAYESMTWGQWTMTRHGKDMRPRMRLLRNQ